MMSLDPPTAQRLDHRLATSQHRDRLPSVVAVLLRDRHAVWHGAAGTVEGFLPTPDTQYRIGSITKTFVAVAVMQLRDAGGLELHDPVLQHLGPAWNQRGAGDNLLQHVTVQHLLMHAGGIPAETEGPWWERTAGGSQDQLAAQTIARSPVSPPGRRFHYSNVGFGILGAVLAHHHDAPWNAVVSRDILRPLAMQRTTTRPQSPAAGGTAVHPEADIVLPEPEHDAGAMAPAGQLWSTMKDLARWAAFLAGDTAHVLSPSTLEQMSVPGVVADLPGAPWTTAHGLGLQVFNDDGTRMVGHGGSMPGFLATVRVDPQTGEGVAVATNTTAGLDAGLAGELLELAREGSPVTPSTWTPTPVDQRLLGLLGTWYWGPTALRITHDHEGLHLTGLDRPGRSSSFVAGTDGTWVGRDGYYAGEVLRPGPAGRHGPARPNGPTHLSLASFVLTRAPYDPPSVVPGEVDPRGWT